MWTQESAASVMKYVVTTISYFRLHKLRVLSELWAWSRAHVHCPDRCGGGYHYSISCFIIPGPHFWYVHYHDWFLLLIAIEDLSQEDLAILKQKGLGRGVDASDSATLQTGEECIRKTIDDGPEKNIQQSLYPSETIQLSLRLPLGFQQVQKLSPALLHWRWRLHKILT